MPADPRFGVPTRVPETAASRLLFDLHSRPAGRWMHIDPCEASIDEPHLYCSGWGKKMTYVIGVGDGQITDLTRKYTADQYEETVASRPLDEQEVVRSIRRTAITKGSPRLKPVTAHRDDDTFSTSY